MERREAAVSKAMPKPCGTGNYGSKIRPNDKLNLRQAPYSYIVSRKTSEYCPGYKKPNLSFLYTLTDEAAKSVELLTGLGYLVPRPRLTSPKNKKRGLD